MTIAPIAFEISNAGVTRPLDAYETACVLADLRRWDAESDEAEQASRFRRFSPDHWVLGSMLAALLSLALALGQIAGVI